METIRVVLDSKLLRAAEAAARRAQLSRSALIREALRAHLKRLEIQERNGATVRAMRMARETPVSCPAGRRRRFGRRKTFRCGEAFSCRGPDALPVSYTHLDVYKRQPP